MQQHYLRTAAVALLIAATLPNITYSSSNITYCRTLLRAAVHYLLQQQHYLLQQHYLQQELQVCQCVPMRVHECRTITYCSNLTYNAVTLLTAAVALLIATTLFNITYNSSTITYCSNITYNAATLLTAGIASHIAAILFITQQHHLQLQ